MTATKPLLPQLAAAGYKPSDITYFALSHYHSDHTANANAFAGGDLDRAEGRARLHVRDKPQGIIQPAQYSALKDAKTELLNNEDFDVFGDGTVVVKSTPGHTPGHQVLFVKLPKTGPVLLAGDLYHYPEERTTGRIPTFEFNAEQSKASPREDRGVHEADRRAALDRARHRHAREAAEGAGIRRIAAAAGATLYRRLGASGDALEAPPAASAPT